MYKFQRVDNGFRIVSLYTGFSAVREKDFHFRGENHDFWEIVCVTDGKLQAAADDRVFILEKGQAIVHNPMQFHNISCTQGCGVEIVIFTFEAVNMPQLQNKVYQIEDLSEVYELCRLARKYFNFSDEIHFDGFKYDLNHALRFVKRLELFILSLNENRSKDYILQSASAKNYLEVVHILNQNVSERLSVEDIAVLCNMSAVGIQKNFAKYAGVGVMEFFNRLKVKKAKALLQSGCSVKETALRLGFTDPNYFSTVFKRITGNSPQKEKRKQIG